MAIGNVNSLEFPNLGYTTLCMRGPTRNWRGKFSRPTELRKGEAAPPPLGPCRTGQEWEPAAVACRGGSKTAAPLARCRSGPEFAARLCRSRRAGARFADPLRMGATQGTLIGEANPSFLPGQTLGVRGVDRPHNPHAHTPPTRSTNFLTRCRYFPGSGSRQRQGVWACVASPSGKWYDG